MLKVYCDGSITGSHWAKKGHKDTLPHAWSGWVAQSPVGDYVHHKSLDLGEHPLHSANVGEYMAVRSALFWLTKNRPLDAARIYSDSQLVMRQLSGMYVCHNERLQVLKQECERLASKLPCVSYEWIPRERNQIADLLSKALQAEFGGQAFTAQYVELLCHQVAVPEPSESSPRGEEGLQEVPARKA